MPTKAAVQPVDDEVHLDHVPRPASERYWALVGARDAAFDRVIGSTGRITEYRNDKLRAERELAELEEAAKDGKLVRRVSDDTYLSQVPDNERLATAHRRAEAARERLDRAQQQHRLLSAETEVYGRLARAAEEYFAATRGTRMKVAKLPGPVLRKGEATIEALDRVREEIGTLRSERRTIAKGPGSLAEAKSVMRAAVADLAKQGEPDLSGLFRAERPSIGWPMWVVPNVTVNGYHVRTVNAAALFASVFQDELIAFLDKRIDSFGAGVEGEMLTAEARAQRLTEIDGLLLDRGYAEQALLDRAAGEGATILPRSDADIRAVLMLASDSPAQRPNP